MPTSGLNKKGYALIIGLILIAIIMISIGIRNKNKDMYEDDESTTPLIILGSFMIAFSIFILMIFSLKKK